MPLCLDSPAAELSDDALVARYRLGDVEALDTLLERYRRFAALMRSEQKTTSSVEKVGT